MITPAYTNLVEPIHFPTTMTNIEANELDFSVSLITGILDPLAFNAIYIAGLPMISFDFNYFTVAASYQF